MENIFIELEQRDIQSKKCERACLIEIQEQRDSPHQAQAHLDELNSLVRTMGIEPICSINVKLRQAHRATLIGTGKMQEIAELGEKVEADIFIFDYDLTPTQQRNLEEFYNQPVIDRQEVILDIFADRASTKEAMLQVALARMVYSLPRLTRAWTHLSRQRGGAKGNRGKGETQLETDRRLVQDRIAKLRKEIIKVSKTRDIQRKKRDQIPFPSVAIVGYTNAGKSSLLNLLTGADVLVEDKLFATLDPTSRKVKLPGGRDIIFTDTVGFVRKLPHLLVDAFMSTLEEAARSDLILNVVDGSSEEWESHMETTEQVLKELGAWEIPKILVVNKSDLMQTPWQSSIPLLQEKDSVLISAAKNKGIEELIQTIESYLNRSRQSYVIHLPTERWDLHGYVHRNATVEKEEFLDDHILIEAQLSSADAKRLEPFIVKNIQGASDK
ncbi:MAG: GTPase HflX [Spirochaetaceae bacterium]|jgi:GTP-binding protein HflX|nr:GTPase HflX [Spirochaetaceae bacterium]